MKRNRPARRKTNRRKSKRKSLATERLEPRQLLAADLGVGDAVVENLRPELIQRDGNRQGNQGQQNQGGQNRRGRNDRGDQNFDLRQLLNVEAREIDGTQNNQADPELGSANTQLNRYTSVEYSDGIAAPAGADRPSARVVSNAVAAQSTTDLNDRNLTDLTWLWGQFIDHDIDLTEPGEPHESFDIEVPAGDPFFDPFGTGTQTISLSRSIYDLDTGNSTDSPREQINMITAFLDGSVVYGSDVERAEALRLHEGGLLKTSDGDLLPFNTDGLENAGGTSDALFLAGDVRANENIALAAMHTLWVREHNRVATELAEADPSLSDQELYEAAKAIVTAEIQAITFNEFLPALLGDGAVDRYRGYDPNVNPQINNVFSGAAYRFGHSMLSSELLRLNNDGTEADEGHIALQDAFFRPGELVDNGIDSILFGAASQQANEIDNQVVDDIRNFLFGPPGAGGFDLASLNIQRGRDHGLADYNQVREDYGLERVTDFSEITSDSEVAQALEDLYGTVDNIDVWVGGLAEDHVRGGSMGELFSAVISDQFERIRDGDRLWYQNIFSGRQLREIENTTLADVIERNTTLENLNDNLFFVDGLEPRNERGDRDDRNRGNVGPVATNDDGQNRNRDNDQDRRRRNRNQRAEMAGLAGAQFDATDNAFFTTRRRLARLAVRLCQIENCFVDRQRTKSTG